MILNLKDYIVPIFSSTGEGKNLDKTEADSITSMECHQSLKKRNFHQISIDFLYKESTHYPMSLDKFETIGLRPKLCEKLSHTSELPGHPCILCNLCGLQDLQVLFHLKSIFKK